MFSILLLLVLAVGDIALLMIAVALFVDRPEVSVQYAEPEYEQEYEPEPRRERADEDYQTLEDDIDMTAVRDMAAALRRL